MDEPARIAGMTEQDRRISEMVAEERSLLRNFIRRRVPNPSMQRTSCRRSSTNWWRLYEFLCRATITYENIQRLCPLLASIPSQTVPGLPEQWSALVRRDHQDQSTHHDAHCAGQFDLIGIRAAQGQRSRKGPCACFPTCHFFRRLFPIRAVSESIQAGCGQVVAHVLKMLVELDVVDLSLGLVVNVSVSAATPWRRS